MPRTPLVLRHLLDPRSRAAALAAPIVDAVNIPLAELPDRTLELPPRGETIPIVGPDAVAEAAIQWLSAHGRRAVWQREFVPDASAPPGNFGRLWRPNDFVAACCVDLSPGRALDVGCGTGRDAVYLASLGWEVIAVDRLPDALAKGRQLAERYAGALGPITWVEADLDHRDPLSTQPFDLIIGVRYLHRPLLGRITGRLRPGGSLIWETFTTTHRTRHGRPASDAHVLQPGELPRLLPGLRVRHFEEGWHGEAHTARIWATRD